MQKETEKNKEERMNMSTKKRCPTVRALSIMLICSMLISSMQASATVLENELADSERENGLTRGGILYESESNNTLSTADTMANDDTMYGKIGSSGDIDYFRVKFTYSGQANFWLGSIPSGKDYDLYLYNSSGTMLASSTSSNTTSTQELIKHYTVSANVWYYMKVVGYNCYDNSSYYKLRAKCYSVKPARIIYDTTCNFSEAILNTAYANAIAEFARNFGIEFNLLSTTYSAQLNGSSCPNTSYTIMCNSNCGNVATCTTNHHKGASRLLQISTSPSYYTFRIVGHRICYYDVGKSLHSSKGGLGTVNGKEAIISTLSVANVPKTIQHELTHNLGGSHNTCVEGEYCALQGDMDEWCTVCTNAILASR